MPLSKTTAMLLRFIHLKSRNRLKGLGTFTLLGHHDQAAAALDLYNLIIDNKGIPTPQTLLQYKHKLFDTLLRPKGLKDDKVACPTDQMLVLTSLLPNGRFRCASALRGQCCRLQHCFRSIVAQTSRLEAEDAENLAFELSSGIMPSTPEATGDAWVEQDDLDKDGIVVGDDGDGEENDDEIVPESEDVFDDEIESDTVADEEQEDEPAYDKGEEGIGLLIYRILLNRFLQLLI